MGDAFRDHPTDDFSVVGQFVGHPPGASFRWPSRPNTPSGHRNFRPITVTPSTGCW
jgi:hypothetical protein